MPQINVADAKKTPQIVIRDNNGNILSVITPRDMQVGFQGNSGNLILKGGLDLNAEIISLTSPSYNVANNQMALFFRNTTQSAIEVILPTPPDENGQTHIIKDYGGNASTYNITVKTSDGSSIDNAASQVIAVNYGAIMFVWTGAAWVSLALGASGAGAGASAGASYVTIASEASLSAERVLTGTAGEIAITDGGANSNVTVSLVSIGTPGTYTFPSSVTVDAKGRITAISSGTSTDSMERNATYVVISATGSLNAERVLTAGTGVAIADGGANGNVTINNVAPGDQNASYLVLALTASLNNERRLSVSGTTGLKLVDSGANNDVTLSINDNIVATVSGTNFSGPVIATGGLTGSLQRLTSGLTYLAGGTGISITTSSNGQVVVTNIGNTAIITGTWRDPGNTFVTTGSVSIDSQNRTASSIGSNVFFFVSGTQNLTGTASRVANFGGDVNISGSLIFDPSRLRIVGSASFGAGTGNVTSSIIFRDFAGTTYFAVDDVTSGSLFSVANFTNGIPIIDLFSDHLIRMSGTLYFGSGTRFSNHFLVSGTRNIVGPAERVAIFEGDVSASGSVTVANGISGSLTRLSDGRSYLVAGSNIIISSQSNGQVTISSTAGTTQAFVTGTWRDPSGSFVTTGSVSIDSLNRSPSTIGTNVFFFVSGSISGSGAEDKKAVFGGDVRISGTLVVGTGSVEIDSNEIRWAATTKVYRSGSDLIFKDATNPSGYSLSQLATSGSSGNSAGTVSAGFLQANYAFVTSTVEWTVPTNNAFAGVPGLTASITTTGSPVLILANANWVAQTEGSQAVFSIAKGGVNLGHSTRGMNVSGPTVQSYNNNGSIFYVDFPPAGTYTYSYIASQSLGTGKISAYGVSPASLIVFEMKGANVVTASSTTEYSIPAASYNGVTGLSASILPTRGPVLLLANINYQNIGAGNWGAMSFFRGTTNLSNDASPTGFAVVVGTTALEQEFAGMMHLDQGASIGSTNTYSVQALNGAGTGKIGAGGQLSSIILWELTDANWKFVRSTADIALGATNTDIAATTPPQAIVSRGRPVLLGANININTTIASGRSSWTFLKNGVSVTTSSKGLQVVDGENNNGWNKQATMFWLDATVSGSNEYKVVGYNVSGSQSSADAAETTFFMYELDPGYQVIAGPWIDSGSQIRTTASVALSGQEQLFATQKASDAFLYVSGSIDVVGPAAKRAFFGGDVVASGAINMMGGVIYNTTIVTGSYYILRDDYVIGVNQPNNNSSTIFTPTGTVAQGRAYKIIDSAGNASSGSIIISGSNGSLIAGASTYVIAMNGGSIEIIRLGTNWGIN